MTETIKRKRGLRGWFWMIVACIFGLPIVLFIAAAVLVNFVSIPVEPENPPRWASATVPPRRAANPAGVPVARRLKAREKTPGSVPTYDQFLEEELRERPDLIGAKKYLELSRRFQNPDQKKALDAFDHDTTQPLGRFLWEEGRPLPASTAGWLRAHPDIVGAFLDFAQSPGLPVRTLDMLANEPDLETVSYPDYFLYAGNRMLAAEGQRQFELGDDAAATKYWRGAMNMAVNGGCDLFRKISGFHTLTVIYMSMSHILAEDAPRDLLAAIQSDLKRVHRDYYGPEWFPDYVRMVLPAYRKELVKQLNQPWTSGVFGWQPGNNKYYFRYEGMDLPRIPEIVGDAVMAMYRKQQVPTVVRDYDRLAEQAIREAAMPWPEFSKCKSAVMRQDLLYGMPNSMYEGLRWSRLWNGESETRLNLLRAAIECGLTTETQVERIAPKQIDRESPWRDPFTGKPLRVINGTSNTLTIYSLGPDAVDQRCRVTYDPTNGIISPGDVWLEAGRVRRTRDGN
ncbi:MAG: hypothetical protein ABFD69_07220 [Candidatus Sumerlaeia bacterium]